MTARDLYITIRRAVLLVLDAFDVYYKVGKHKDDNSSIMSST
jgi:hypothetical protein